MRHRHYETYGLTALGRETSTPPKLQEYGTLYLFLLVEAWDIRCCDIFTV